MTRIAKNLFLSAAVLLAGLATIGLLMTAFVHQAEAREAHKRADGTTLEVSINNTGGVLVRGAEVTAVSGSVITARTEWGASALTWTVDTNGDTDFVSRGNQNLDIDDIDVGDTVSFSGTLDIDGSAFNVDADVVKNWSLDTNDTREDRNEARVEAKTELTAKWGDWMRGIPLMNWFSKHDNR